MIKRYRRQWLFIIFCYLNTSLIPGRALEGSRITRSCGHEFRPFWDPAGETIIFPTSSVPGNQHGIGAVQADGTGERLVATGLQEGFGICGCARLAWVGKTGNVITCEESGFHEYLEFTPGAAVLRRGGNDGDDEAFRMVLLVDGGSGSQLLEVSRDGTMVMWRHSRMGNSGEVSLRVAPYAELMGGNASELGRAVVQIATTTLSDIRLADACIGPHGTFLVVSEPHGAGQDLVLYDATLAGKEPRRLTRNGEAQGRQNINPAVSPDGRWVAFASRSFYDSTVAGALVKARHDLVAVRIADQKIVQLTATDVLDEVSPSWSPEGRRIAFARVDTRAAGTVEPGEPDNVNLYVMPFSEPKE